MNRRCVCGGELDDRTTEVAITTADGPLVLPSVPVSACTRCGSSTYTVATVQRLEALMRARAEPSSRAP